MNDWDVHLVNSNELFDHNYSMHTDFLFTVRNNPFYDESRKDEENYQQTPYNVLGPVRGRYNVLQNEEMADFAELLLEGGRFDTAGSIKFGTKVFMSMALDSEMTIDENGVNEKINNYLVVFNSHDGSSGLTAMVTNIRPVCTNTLDWGLKHATQKFTIRHTKSMEERMKLAKKTLDLAQNYNTKFKEDATQLFQESVTDQEFLGMIQLAYPMPDQEKKGNVTRWLGKIDSLQKIWVSDTIEGAGIKNTAWGVLQTLTEDAQWNRNIKAGNTENFFAAGAGFDDAARDMRSKFHNLVSTVAASK